MNWTKKEDEGQPFAPVTSHQNGDLTVIGMQTTHDAVFGEMTEGGPNYRNVGWLGTIALMLKTQIGLGVLSIPVAFDTLGLIPGIICLLVIATMTTWSNYEIGVFKLNHPEVYGIDDVGRLLFGRVGYTCFGAAFCLYWVFVSASGMLSISIALNALSEHGTCTAIFVAVAAVVGFGLSSIRTLGRISWLAWIGLVSILTAIFVLTISVGVQDRPAAVSHVGPWHSDYALVQSNSWAKSVAAVSSLVFAYAGTPAFFSIISEMRDPRLYTRALLICQIIMTCTYICIGTVVYYYCGSYVASPALGSAGALMKKVCYGLALPGLVVTVTIVTHLPAKYAFLWILRDSEHLSNNSWRHWSTWLGCTFATAMMAYVIASAIPVFDSLISLVGALLGTLMSFQPMAAMWLYDNWDKSKGFHEKPLRWYGGLLWATIIIVVGFFLLISGTYGSVVGVKDSYEQSGGSAAWSCTDNSR